ncbi:prolyl oligopeptidase family serine peptidase [Dyella sp. LX-66]|uniref:S9 family peptidase n=1 Tax=unclassified Dyella TaxID=2634549 RepID=UPI001BE11853|nr:MULTISPECIES: prolyl oligopeptidase family serine peptidase [unclassified Dyella]MBT2117699.1 prolyl oligopeptidase family serine peptidase [Dyella sp. LX-1]MBT2141214.1 prolyl oligopeptidase family serine peptidase [Dyella sp. LX-66]
MRRMLLAALAALAASPALFADTPAASPAGTLDLETIMASPDWIGAAVEAPYWSVDGRSLYYSLKRDGSKLRDRYRIDVASGRSEKLGPEALAQADGPAVFDRQHKQAAFVLHGDVFLVEAGTGKRVQVTRTPETETSPRFSSDGRSLQYRQGKQWFVYDIAAGVASSAAVLNVGEDPRGKQPDALGRDQLRLFKALRAAKADKDAARANEETLAAADPGRAPRPIWLGDVGELVDAELSPDGRWMLVVTQPKDAGGKTPELTHYVTESGYAEQQSTRTYVGRRDPVSQSLLLVDLRARKSYPLDAGVLPGIKDDPLKDLRAKAIADLNKAGRSDEAKALKAPEQRAVRIISDADDGGGGGIAWSDDGGNLAIQLRAIDNKDRWIASVDFDKHALVNQHRLTDRAWINWNFNDFGWLKDGRTLWYLSEETGYSQLYAKSLGGKAHALTSGKFELSHPVLSEDGQWFYLRSNEAAPYSYDVYRLPAQGGQLARLTRYQGMDDFVLSPDGRQLAVLHSAPYVLPQLAVQDSAGGAPRELTQTMKPAFAQRAWIAPKIVGVASSHGAGTVWAKYYGPADEAAAASKPAVIFVHGAGYLQNVTLSWSNYFREQMFHNLLVQQGYVVLDMDYRASEGYGRDWRDAIYRQMGHPELEDLLDGKAWLVKEHGVDPRRVGIYGGSYGGFMTLMALLRAPGEFAAGAALRPVSDWSSYNHEYTSNILNDPQLDPEAYTASSPIEYADKLQDALLIQHGLVDDNVLASDSIRLYQRFIELHKRNFWMSLYPMERHGFVQPDSWYDEYRRIDELFDTYVKPARTQETAAGR